MLGIKEIATFIPKKKISNYEMKDKFKIDDDFIENKLGINRVSIKEDNEDTSDLCVRAFKNLEKKVKIDKNEIDVLILVTQNPDMPIPHASAIIHGKLNFPENCACFDISLGCSGYVYALSIITAFMRQNKLRKGLLFTSDPYSKIINRNDKNTSLLFGDAACVTLIADDPLYAMGNFTFGTIGKDYKELICKDGKLYMNGRAIFNFSAVYIPKDIRELIKRNKTTLKEIDKFIFHQASKFVLDTLARRLKLEDSQTIFDISEYGNTVSSSIPIILEKEMKKESNKQIVLSGFGVGLSWASTLLKREKEN